MKQNFMKLYLSLLNIKYSDIFFIILFDLNHADLDPLNGFMTFQKKASLGRWTDFEGQSIVLITSDLPSVKITEGRSNFPLVKCLIMSDM